MEYEQVGKRFWNSLRVKASKWWFLNTRNEISASLLCVDVTKNFSWRLPQPESQQAWMKLLGVIGTPTCLMYDNRSCHPCNRASLESLVFNKHDFCNILHDTLRRLNKVACISLCHWIGHVALFIFNFGFSYKQSFNLFLFSVWDHGLPSSRATRMTPQRSWKTRLLLLLTFWFLV